MSVSHGTQNRFVSAGIVYAWMYADNFDEKIGGLVCEVNGRYRIEELEEARLTRVILDLHEKTYSQYYLGELNFVTRGESPSRKRCGTALSRTLLYGLCPSRETR